MNRFYTIALALLIAPTASFHAMDNPEKEQAEKILTLDQRFTNLNVGTSDLDEKLILNHKTITQFANQGPQLLETYYKASIANSDAMNTKEEQINKGLHNLQIDDPKQQLAEFSFAAGHTLLELKTAFSYYSLACDAARMCSVMPGQLFNRHKTRLIDNYKALYNYLDRKTHIVQAYTTDPEFHTLLAEAKNKLSALQKDSLSDDIRKQLTDSNITLESTVSDLVSMLESAQK